MIRVIRQVLFVVALPAALLAGWWFLTADSTSFFSPPLATILGTFDDTWFSQPFGKSRFMHDVLPSVGRLLAGYLVALVAGIALGVAIGLSRALRAFCEPVLELLPGGA